MHPVLPTVGACALIGLWVESGRAGAALEPFLDMIGCYFLVRPVILPSCPVMLRTLPLMMNNEVRASDHDLAQHLVTAADACCCRATDQTCSVLIGPRPVTSVELVSSRSYVQLGSYLRAWTLLDILGVLLGF